MNSSKFDVKIFVLDSLQPDTASKALLEQFKRYKQTGDTQGVFGRDELYNASAQAVLNELHHVHIIELPEQYNSTKSQFHNTTDKKHIVYCPGFSNPHYYYIINILTPNAHAQATAGFIAEANAQATIFRNKH